MGNYNGYIENSDVEENYADFSLRIPTDKVDAFLDNMTKKDNPFTVKRKSYSSSDVTADYVDVEGRLAAKKKALEKYYDLMDQAKSINETMEVLNAISDLEGEIEGFESQLKSYDSQIDYTEVHVSVTGKGATSEPIKDEFGGIGETLAHNFALFLEFLAGAIFVVPTALLIMFLIVKVVKLADNGKKRNDINKPYFYNAPPQNGNNGQDMPSWQTTKVSG